MTKVVIKIKPLLFMTKEFRRALDNHLKGLNPPHKPNQSHGKAT